MAMPVLEYESGRAPRVDRRIFYVAVAVALVLGLILLIGGRRSARNVGLSASREGAERIECIELAMLLQKFAQGNGGRYPTRLVDVPDAWGVVWGRGRRGTGGFK